MAVNTAPRNVTQQKNCRSKVCIWCPLLCLPSSNSPDCSGPLSPGGNTLRNLFPQGFQWLEVGLSLKGFIFRTEKEEPYLSKKDIWSMMEFEALGYSFIHSMLESLTCIRAGFWRHENVRITMPKEAYILPAAWTTIKKTKEGTSLVVQWLRICQPVHGFDPWSRKIPHAMEQLSQCATTAEPMYCSYWNLHAPDPMLCEKRSHCNEKSVQRNSRAAPTCCS